MKAKAAPSFCWCDGVWKDNFGNEMHIKQTNHRGVNAILFTSHKPTSRTAQLETQLCMSRPAHQEPRLNADDRGVRRMTAVTDRRESARTEVWTEEQDEGDGEIESEEWGRFCVSDSFFLIWDLSWGAGKGISVFSFISEFKISTRLA